MLKWLLIVIGALLVPVAAGAQVPYGPVQRQLIPDCPDTGGQHLNFSLTTGIFTCGTTGNGGSGGSFGSEAPNLLFASPNGSTGVPAFRALAAADLPLPSTSSLGGVQAATSVAHQWISSISTSGVPQLSQPAAADISGLAPSATTDTTNAGNISSGTLGSGLLAGSYTGITGVGTIGTGVWQGTAIANAYLANSSTTVLGATCTLGSACSPSVPTASLTPAETFPASGGLVGTTDVQTLANKTLTNVAVTTSAAVTAAGTNQGTAAPLTNSVSVVTSCPLGTGVVLSGTLNAPQLVLDRDATTSYCTAYPPSGAQIDSNGTNNPVSVASGSQATFRCTSSTQCYSGI